MSYYRARLYGGETRRLALMRVSPEFLVECSKAGAPYVLDTVESPLPDDARLYDIASVPWSRELYLVLESATFDEVSDGAELVELPSPVTRILRERVHSTIVIEALQLQRSMILSGERPTDESNAVVEEALYQAYSSDLIPASEKVVPPAPTEVAS